MVNKRVRNAVLGCNLTNDRMISVRFQGKPFTITVIQVYAPTTNAEEVEVERFYKYLQDLLKEMGIPDHLICLLRNLYAGQEATVRTGHGTTDWFQIGKGVRQGCIL